MIGPTDWKHCSSTGPDLPLSFTFGQERWLLPPKRDRIQLTRTRTDPLEPHWGLGFDFAAVGDTCAVSAKAAGYGAKSWFSGTGAGFSDTARSQARVEQIDWITNHKNRTVSTVYTSHWLGETVLHNMGQHVWTSWSSTVYNSYFFKTLNLQVVSFDRSHLMLSFVFFGQCAASCAYFPHHEGVKRIEKAQHGPKLPTFMVPNTSAWVGAAPKIPPWNIEHLEGVFILHCHGRWTLETVTLESRWFFGMASKRHRIRCVSVSERAPKTSKPQKEALKATSKREIPAGFAWHSDQAIHQAMPLV